MLESRVLRRGVIKHEAPVPSCYRHVSAFDILNTAEKVSPNLHPCYYRLSTFNSYDIQGKYYLGYCFRSKENDHVRRRIAYADTSGRSTSAISGT